MAHFRQSRNIEASVIDRIKEILNEVGFTSNVEKTFTQAYEVSLPVIVVRVGETAHPAAEISTTATRRKVQVLIDIFASNDGQRLDFKDCLIEYLKEGITYYEYTTGNSKFQQKIKNGLLKVSIDGDNQVFPDIDKSTLEEHDRNRHLVVLSVSLGQIE